MGDMRMAWRPRDLLPWCPQLLEDGLPGACAGELLGTVLDPAATWGAGGRILRLKPHCTLGTLLCFWACAMV